MLSIIIPSRNEKYLNKTIEDLLVKTIKDFEIIVVLEGYWPEIIQDKRVHYIHFTVPRGMRGAINAGVALAKGEYLMKCDAHCKFDKGFDMVMESICLEKTVVIPRRYRLDPERWEIIIDGRQPIDRMYLSKDLHGRDWQEGNTDTMMEETPSSQGSCWMMRKDYYKELELLDEDTYGTFFSEMQEIGLKCWLSGGRMIVDKHTWYAHWHKTDGRGYSLGKDQGKLAEDAVNKWKDKGWHKQIYPLSWLWEHFPTMPKE